MDALTSSLEVWRGTLLRCTQVQAIPLTKPIDIIVIRHQMVRSSPLENCLVLLRDGDNLTNPSTRDPFHEDPILASAGLERLGIDAFTGTGHDRVHMAPSNALGHDLWPPRAAVSCNSCAVPVFECRGHRQNTIRTEPTRGRERE